MHVETYEVEELTTKDPAEAAFDEDAVALKRSSEPTYYGE